MYIASCSRLATINLSKFGTIQGCATNKTYLKSNVFCTQIILMIDPLSVLPIKGTKLHMYSKNSIMYACSYIPVECITRCICS